MSSRILYDTGTSLDLIRPLRVAMIGYGSQGRAHALNLRDSGVAVNVGQRPGGRGWELAEADGFRPVAPGDAVRDADLVCLMVPDQMHGNLWRNELAASLKPGAHLLTCHGFSFHYGLVEPPSGSWRILVAPKGQGHMVRSEYLRGGGVPCLVAIGAGDPEEAFQLGLAYAAAIGGGKGGVIRTTIAAETETDLFGEQAVLCGGLVALVRAGFDTLVEAGYQPELAYFECLHELRIITDLLQARGIGGMRSSISTTARYGDVTRGPRIIDATTRANMRQVLEEIRSGAFAREFLADDAAGQPAIRAAAAETSQSQIEITGRELRSMMPWLQDGN